VRLSPIGALAMAAGIAGLAVLGTVRAARLWQAPARQETFAAASAPETVHVVRFVFTDPEASAVSLVGDFNGWSKNATPLTVGTADGTWIVSLELPRGRHEYAFVVRRGREERWSSDPAALPVRDDFGTETSIVTVGGPGAARERPSTS
jgi:1,4-alpha-glucan branching enzyme